MTDTMPASLANPVTSSQETIITPARSILVADDNRDGAEIMAMLLEDSGHIVHVAFSGPDALALAAEKTPDIAILDIGMPGMSGYEVARRIRAAPWGTDMILVAVTGRGQEDDKRAAVEAGFNRHLIKPVDPAELEAMIRSV